MKIKNLYNKIYFKKIVSKVATFSKNTMKIKFEYI